MYSLTNPNPNPHLSPKQEPVDFFKNLLSGGKLQREADEQRERRRREEEQ
tara:strand:- start:93 stop:242 length:150 start_codon:yes stop_codon:yes gene_type:complete